MNANPSKRPVREEWREEEGDTAVGEDGRAFKRPGRRNGSWLCSGHRAYTSKLFNYYRTHRSYVTSSSQLSYNSDNAYN